VNYDVMFSLEAVEDVLRITMLSHSKAAVLKASKQIQAALVDNPQMRASI